MAGGQWVSKERCASLTREDAKDDHVSEAFLAVTVHFNVFDSDTYTHATSTLLSFYSDSALHNWLVEHGHLRSGAQVKRDELVAMVSKHYNEAVAKGAELLNYISWLYH